MDYMLGSVGVVCGYVGVPVSVVKNNFCFYAKYRFSAPKQRGNANVSIKNYFQHVLFDEVIYILLRKTHFSNPIPYWLHSFFKRLINFLFKDCRVVVGYG